MTLSLIGVYNHDLFDNYKVNDMGEALVMYIHWELGFKNKYYEYRIIAFKK